jgi:lipopolysaccharide/colanic/teichoic acid biosynthesis glycosyltransferase
MTTPENAHSDEHVEDRVAYHTGPSGRDLRPRRAATRYSGAARSDPVEALFSLCRRHDLPFGVLVLRARDRSEGSRRRAYAGRDSIQARVWRLVDTVTRQTDVSAPWGSDGAIVFCPATPPEGTKELAERICAGSGDLRISLGTASLRTDGFTLADLVACANAREMASHSEPGGPPPPTDGPQSPPSNGGLGSRRPSGGPLKRLFDLSVVVVAAPLWLPLLALVATAVKVSDPTAPVLFVQERTGRGGRRFRMYKFRTMVTDAELQKQTLERQNERSWPDFKIEGDPRVTPIGRRLRASSLDELPQLWNVLLGDMSLVGPRPTSFPADTYETWQTARLEATPGVTGLWQIEARNSGDFCERIRLDLRYVARRSFLYDLRILLRTVPAVLWDREGH